MSNQFFTYGEEEKNYLKKKDKRLGEVIDKIGHINRLINRDLFSSIIKIIIGQQISTKAQETIWQRLKDGVGEVTASNILKKTNEELQAYGLSFRKTVYIVNLSQKVENKEFNIEKLKEMSDEEVIRELSSLKGIGIWTAEMLMIFSMQRPNILSYGDLAIVRGLRMIYRHREIDQLKFERFRKRYSPYASVASLYLWAVAGGAIEELTDPKK